MRSLKLLIVEDKPLDAELMVETLVSAGFDPSWERVTTEQEYLARLSPSLTLFCQITACLSLMGYAPCIY